MKDNYIRWATFILDKGHIFKKVFGHLLPMKYNVSLDIQSLRRVIFHLAVIKDVWWPSKSVKHDKFKQTPCQDIRSTLKTQILEKYLLVLEISWHKFLIHFKSWLLYFEINRYNFTKLHNLCWMHSWGYAKSHTDHFHS